VIEIRKKVYAVLDKIGVRAMKEIRYAVQRRD
jgi:hypothetical protein